MSAFHDAEIFKLGVIAIAFLLVIVLGVLSNWHYLVELKEATRHPQRVTEKKQ